MKPKMERSHIVTKNKVPIAIVSKIVPIFSSSSKVVKKILHHHLLSYYQVCSFSHELWETGR
jgi:hypothetical protein